MQAATKNGTATPPLEGPANIDAERSVLGSVLLDPGVLPEVMEQLPFGRMFHLPAHQEIWQAIQDIATEGSQPDLTGLAAHLKAAGKLDAVGGYIALAGLEQFVVATSSAGEHARIVRELHEHREIIEACRSGAMSSRRAEHKPRAVAERVCQGLMSAVDAGDDHARYIGMGELMEMGVEDTFAKADLRRRGDVLGVPFGLIDLDRLTGGLQAGELTIIAARPSIGKTALAMHTFRTAIQTIQQTVAFFSLEMGATPIATRIVCAEAGIDADRARKGFLSDVELGLYKQAATRLTAFPGLVRDSSKLSGVDLLMQARLLKARYSDLALIIIDGLWLMDHPQGRGLNYATMVGETSRLVKRAAKETGVPIMLLHQLSRNNEMRAGNRDRRAGRGDRPTLSDLRDSGAIEQDADLVIFIYRERREQQQADGENADDAANDPERNDLDEEPNPYVRGPGRRAGNAQEGDGNPNMIPTELIVAKHRNGPIGTARALFEVSTQRWHDQAGRG